MIEPHFTIGLDIGSRAIKFVGINARTGEARVSGVIPRSQPGAEIDATEISRIAAVLRRRGIWSRSVVLSAPPSMASNAMLELPPRSSGAPIERLAQIEMARMLRCEPNTIETVSWDVAIGGKAAQHTSVMAVACSTSQATRIAEGFEDAGVVIEAIEPGCIALARVVRRWLRASSFVVADLGASGGRICVVNKGTVTLQRELGELGMLERLGRAAAPIGCSVEALWRLLRTGESDVGQTTRSAGEIVRAFTERLAEDVERAVKESLGYARTRGGSVEPELIALAGWGGATSGLAEKITEQSGHRATAVGKDQAGGVVSSVEAMAAGLGMRGNEEFDA